MPYFMSTLTKKKTSHTTGEGSLHWTIAHSGKYHQGYCKKVAILYTGKTFHNLMKDGRGDQT